METYKIVIILFQMDDKDTKFCFFQETFLLTDISMDIAFRIFFFMWSNIKVKFNNRGLK